MNNSSTRDLIIYSKGNFERFKKVGEMTLEEWCDYESTNDDDYGIYTEDENEDEDEYEDEDE